MRFVAPVTCFGLFFSLAAHAGVPLLQNGGFEDPNGAWVQDAGGLSGFMSLQPGSTSIPGWIVSTNSQSDGPTAWIRAPVQPFTGSGYAFTAWEGSYYFDLVGVHSNALNSIISQTISVAQGTSYKIDFNWGNISDGLVTVTVDGANVVLSTPLGNASYPGQTNAWTLMEGTFVGGSNPNPVLSFGYGPPGQNAVTIVIIDGVSLTAASSTDVPEPMTLSLFGMALAGLAASRSRRAGGKR